jgi:hypothetical protein
VSDSRSGVGRSRRDETRTRRASKREEWACLRWRLHGRSAMPQRCPSLVDLGSQVGYAATSERAVQGRTTWHERVRCFRDAGASFASSWTSSVVREMIGTPSNGGRAYVRA